MGHRPLRREAEIHRQVERVRERTEQVERRQLAGRWWEPDCTGDSDDGCYGIEPPLLNGFAQPAPGSGDNGDDLETFAFRLHTDASLELRGHLDVSGAVSGDVAVTLPGAGVDLDGNNEIDFRPPRDQFFQTVMYDGAVAVPALVYVFAVSGDVKIVWPFS